MLKLIAKKITFIEKDFFFPFRQFRVIFWLFFCNSSNLNDDGDKVEISFTSSHLLINTKKGIVLTLICWQRVRLAVKC